MEDHGRDQDAPPRQSINPNVFDDEYAVDPDDFDFDLGVADGFRPGRPLGATRDDQGLQAASSRQSFGATTPEPGVRRMPSRNSTAKPPATRDSFAIAHDGVAPAIPSRNALHNRGGSSHTSALMHRSSVSSNGSFATMARSDSPYGTGPSHPYGMYPQNTTLARSSSGTTTSTVRQPHRAFSTQRPTHPYASYAQNVPEDEDEEHISPAPIIPVGFPGLNTGYHRQIGPDGEEQDIIGPDGHTEQLPPYTRYPEEGPMKQSLAVEPSPSPTANIPGSQDVLVSPSASSTQQARAVPTVIPMSQSSGDSSNGESGITEKSWRRTSWRDLGKKRVLWNKIPLWALLMFLALVLVFAVILGAAIGSFAAREKMQKHKGHPPVVTVVSTASMFDASLIPTPSGLAPLPTGTFALPMTIPQLKNANCLTVANQNTAWSCVFPGPFLQLIVGPSPGDGLPYASIQPMGDDDDDVKYGVQPPTLTMQSLSLVIDQDYLEFGPAMHWQAYYNKEVILPEGVFAAGDALRIRGDRPAFYHREVKPGDQPWVCYWNQTFIEGYLYVTDNSSAATVTSSSPTTTSSTQTSLPTPESTTSTPSSAPPSPSTSATPSSWSYPTFMSEFASYSTPISVWPRGDDARPPFYPRIVKMEERRVSNSPQPVCQKMQLLDSGELAPAYDSSGNTIIVKLQESDPSMSQFSQAAGTTTASPTGLEKRKDPSNACHCQWMFQ